MGAVKRVSIAVIRTSFFSKKRPTSRVIWCNVDKAARDSGSDKPGFLDASPRAENALSRSSSLLVAFRMLPVLMGLGYKIDKGHCRADC